MPPGGPPRPPPLVNVSRPVDVGATTDCSAYYPSTWTIILIVALLVLWGAAMIWYLYWFDSDLDSMYAVSQCKLRNLYAEPTPECALIFAKEAVAEKIAADEAARVKDRAKRAALVKKLSAEFKARQIALEAKRLTDSITAGQGVVGVTPLPPTVVPPAAVPMGVAPAVPASIPTGMPPPVPMGVPTSMPAGVPMGVPPVPMGLPMGAPAGLPKVGPPPPSSGGGIGSSIANAIAAARNAVIGTDVDEVLLESVLSEDPEAPAIGDVDTQYAFHVGSNLGTINIYGTVRDLAPIASGGGMEPTAAGYMGLLDSDSDTSDDDDVVPPVTSVAATMPPNTPAAPTETERTLVAGDAVPKKKKLPASSVTQPRAATTIAARKVAPSAAQ